MPPEYARTPAAVPRHASRPRCPLPPSAGLPRERLAASRAEPKHGGAARAAVPRRRAARRRDGARWAGARRRERWARVEASLRRLGSVGAAPRVPLVDRVASPRARLASPRATPEDAISATLPIDFAEASGGRPSLCAPLDDEARRLGGRQPLLHRPVSGVARRGERAVLPARRRGARRLARPPLAPRPPRSGLRLAAGRGRGEGRLGRGLRGGLR